MRTLWRNRRLMRSMVRRDILARYRGSFAGAAWTFLNPLLLMATYFFVFGVVLADALRRGSKPQRIHSLFPCGNAAVARVRRSSGRSPHVILEHR
jgi:ABC-type polysaccharide/polyol phosphate export permease